ncbi:hypothetical protein DWF00_18080 [Bosea caraganae]|uniref:Uncharacterized protein n=1 Tax=Bosea caraganae TaxID=2763117 RepID=A0A370L7T3_9HYPH|nr:hypothetical protein [Bosea caraganae]RDJ25108.1 hypothetical protein DWF00_18080 [Bosea caraganae]RDJ26218.1 hypothetical protein DWE98_10300 [Bosea caraganae]
MTSAPPPDQGRFGLRRALMLVLQGVLSVLILIDEVVRPLYRPIAGWVSQRRLVAQAEAFIARQPRLAILALLAIPFAIAEPLKLVGLVLIAREQVGLGATVLVLAHLASFLIVERIYHAGREKLLTYRWLNWIMTLLDGLRSQMLAWLKASPVYAVAMQTRDAIRRWWGARSA